MKILIIMHRMPDATPPAGGGGGNTYGIGPQAIIGAASGAIGMGVQRLGVGYDYRKQRKQQNMLNNQQIEFNDRMSRMQNEYEMEMWERTGYGAQVDQMNRAGVNPALLYGMSGGGGQTTGGSKSGGNAPVAPDANTRGATGAMMGMGLQTMAQTALLQAQKENVEADTANKKADIPVKGAQVPNIEADTKNKGQQFKVGEAEAQNIAQDTVKKVQEIEMLVTQNKIQRESANDQIKMIREQAIGQALENLLTQAKTANTKEDTALKTEQIQEVKRRVINMYQENERAWQELSMEDRRTKVAEALKDIVEEYQWTIPLGAGLEVIDKIMRHTPAGKANPIKGFKRY